MVYGRQQGIHGCLRRVEVKGLKIEKNIRIYQL
jgi:hypothetical protein